MIATRTYRPSAGHSDGDATLLIPADGGRSRNGRREVDRSCSLAVFAKSFLREAVHFIKKVFGGIVERLTSSYHCVSSRFNDFHNFVVFPRAFGDIVPGVPEEFYNLVVWADLDIS